MSQDSQPIHSSPNAFNSSSSSQVSLSPEFIHLMTGMHLYTCLLRLTLDFCEKSQGISWIASCTHWGSKVDFLKEKPESVTFYPYDENGKFDMTQYVVLSFDYAACCFMEGFLPYEESVFASHMPRIVFIRDEGAHTDSVNDFDLDTEELQEKLSQLEFLFVFPNGDYQWMSYPDIFTTLNDRAFFYCNRNFYQVLTDSHQIQSIPFSEIHKQINFIPWNVNRKVDKLAQALKDRQSELAVFPSIPVHREAPFVLSGNNMKSGLGFSTNAMTAYYHVGNVSVVEHHNGQALRSVASLRFYYLIPKDYGAGYYSLLVKDKTVCPFLDSLDYAHHAQNYQHYGFVAPYDPFVIIDNIYVIPEWRRVGVATTIISRLADFLISIGLDPISCALWKTASSSSLAPSQQDVLPASELKQFSLATGAKPLVSLSNQTEIMQFIYF